MDECVLSCVCRVEELFCCRLYFLIDFVFWWTIVSSFFFLCFLLRSLSLFLYFLLLLFSKQVWRRRKDVLRRDRRARRSEIVRSFSFTPAPFFSLSFSLAFHCGDRDSSLLCINELGSCLKLKLFWEEKEGEKKRKESDLFTVLNKNAHEGETRKK